MKVSFELNPSTVGRLLLGLILVWAGLGKLANLQEFYASLLGYRLPLPGVLLRAVAALLPWIELLSGLLLVANLRLRAGLVWAVLLFAVFAICTGQAWLRGLEVACGCLNLRFLGVAPGSETATWLESVKFAFLRSLVLGSLAVHCLRTELRRSA